MTNIEIREEMKAAKIPYWKLGDVLGVHENTVMRKLRRELSDADRERFEKAIAEIKAAKNKKPSECLQHPDGGAGFSAQRHGSKNHAR